MHTLKKILVLLAKSITIFLTILTFVFLAISFFKKEWIESGIHWIGIMIQSLGNWNYLIAFASACIESLPIIGTAVPGMNIMILVGGFWGKEHIIMTIIMASIGAMIGNYIGYWIGKKIGKELIEKYGDWFGVGKTEEKILHKQLEKNGFWYITLGKFHNFTRSFIPFVAGTGGMIEKRFWTYNMIGSVIWATSINLIGVFFVSNYETILENFGKISLGIIILIGVYFWFFKRESLIQYWHDKNQEIEEKMQKSKNQSATKK